MQHQPLDGYHVVSLAINLPGPLTASKLVELGAYVTKVEPPTGDPMALYAPDLYQSLITDQKVLQIDLKSDDGQTRFQGLLEQADLLLTSSRPAALGRLGLSWEELQARFPKLVQVAIVGFAEPHQNVPGHDLTYQAGFGLIDPPRMPRALIADVGGAQSAVVAAMSLLLARERGQQAGYVEVSLEEAASEFGVALRGGLTSDGGILGGAFPGYQLYETADGWIALAALEPAFWSRLQRELGIVEPTFEGLQSVFFTRTAIEWESWALQRDLPIAGVRGAVKGK